MSLEIQNLHVRIEEREILHGVDLKVEKGQTHALMGPNGSGKSTLANTIMGNPNYEVTEGQILFNGEDLTEADPDERARAGPVHGVPVPGHDPRRVGGQLPPPGRERAPRRADEGQGLRQAACARTWTCCGSTREFVSRYLNEGFSGGEKKRAEILQLAMLRPEIAVLDETDSGLDIDALRIVADGVNQLRGPELGTLIITHYTRILELREAGLRAHHARRPDRPRGRPGAGRRAGGQGLRVRPRGGGAPMPPPSWLEDMRRQALEAYEAEPVPTWRRSGFWTTTPAQPRPRRARGAPLRAGRRAARPAAPRPSATTSWAP